MQFYRVRHEIFDSFKCVYYWNEQRLEKTSLGFGFGFCMFESYKMCSRWPPCMPTHSCRRQTKFLIAFCRGAAFREKCHKFHARCFVANLASCLVHSRRLSTSSNPIGRSHTCLNLDSLAAMVSEYGARLAAHRISTPKAAIFYLNSAPLLRPVETKLSLIVF